jgi:hypothetical protein
MVVTLLDETCRISLFFVIICCFCELIVRESVFQRKDDLSKYNNDVVGLLSLIKLCFGNLRLLKKIHICTVFCIVSGVTHLYF